MGLTIAITAIPSCDSATRLIEAAEMEFFTTGTKTVVRAIPADIVRAVRCFRRDGVQFSDFNNNGQTGIVTSHLTIHSCGTHCKE